MQQPIIQCKNVNKSYNSKSSDVVIYNGLNRDVAQGDSVAIMGPSGSGKSTLLHLISGLDNIDQGSVTIAGKVISLMSDDERTSWRSTHVGFIFQQFHLIPNLTVQDNIDLVIDISGASRRYDTSELLKLVGLEGYERRFPYQLSGGEQQRVAIARAFVGQLPILLADEPTGNLDHANATKVMELMMQLHHQSDTTIVLITHDPKIAEYVNRRYDLVDGDLVVHHK